MKLEDVIRTAAAELASGTADEARSRILAALEMRLKHPDISQEEFLLLIGDGIALTDPPSAD
ncbi:MAG: hypothetical protein LBS96_07175 [Oscillospiraceae bacterium]|nr:hypothetical protein [Oscillospiraceae bacterium]